MFLLSEVLRLRPQQCHVVERKNRNNGKEPVRAGSPAARPPPPAAPAARAAPAVARAADGDGIETSGAARLRQQ